ncbi:MAG: helix-turn-helix domain-containing protein [Phycisphaeraceae bacterium]|nr:helix-turn-helix domain-containing protein [Phycisphaeraceae bacterium]
MAKLFYTIEEVCRKLGKTESEVRALVTSGQLQEFRDRDRLMFKVEQIDLLAGDEETGDVHLDLEDSHAGASGLGLSASGLALDDSRVGTRTPAGPADSDAGDSDAGRAFDEDLSLEAVGSGSGLLDLTRESDDTSLGAQYLEEVYSGEEHVEIPANASGLFEAATAESSPDEAIAASGIAPMPIVLETYDGTGSGLGVGLMIGAIVAMVCLGIMMISVATGTTPQLATTMSSNLLVWAGGLLGITIVLGLVGLVIGKASE